jgi:hypothetical protein
MSTAQIYIETQNGRKIAVRDIDGCVVSVQTTSGKELLRIPGKELALYKVVASFREELVKEHGSVLGAGKITEITADEFELEESWVRRCARRYEAQVKNAA